MKKVRLAAILMMVVMALLIAAATGSASAEYGAKALTLNVETTTTFNNTHGERLLSYTPAETGYYVFSDETAWAEPDYICGISVYIFDDGLHPIKYFDTVNGFEHVVKLEAGKTYYFTVTLSSGRENESAHKVKLSRYAQAIYADEKDLYYSFKTPASQTDLEAEAIQTGNTELSYQWYRIEKGADGNESRILLEGETNETLQVQYAQEATVYVCVITAGDETIEVRKEVYPDSFLFASALTPRTVIIQPGEQTTLEILVESSGYTPWYQWFKQVNFDYVEIENATEASYTIADGQPGKYHCAIFTGNDEYAAREFDFEVLVDNDFQAEAASNTYSHADQGEEVTLSVSAKCKNGTPSIQWYKNDETTNEMQLISGATGSSYTFKVNADGIYVCRVSDRYNNEKYLNFYVYCNKNAEEHGFTVRCIGENYRSAEWNTPVELEVEATGAEGAEFTYQWYGERSLVLSPISGATGKKYTVTNPGQYYRYHCFVSDGNQEESCSFDIYTANGFTASTEGDSERMATTGDEVTLKVAASLTGDSGEEDNRTLAYRWYQQGEGIETDRKIGENQDQITVTAGTRDASYICVVTDGYTEKQVYFSIHIVKPASNLQVTAAGSNSKTGTPDSLPTLTVNVTGATGTPEYKWYRTDRRVTGGGQSYTLLTGNTNSITADRSSEYICTVTDGSKSFASTIFNVQISSGLTAIASGNEPSNRSVIAGETTTLGVTATSSSQTISYQWYRGEQLGNSFYTIPGANSAEYQTTPIWNSCRYLCQINDGYNTQTVDFSISMNNRLTAVTDGDREIYVRLGEEVQMKVNASCLVGKIYYSWYEDYYTEENGYTYNFLNTSGDTLKVTAAAGQRNYTCEVRDQYLNRMSVSFSVTVCPENFPEMQITTNLTEGQDGTYSIEAGKPITVTLENVAGYVGIPNAEVFAYITGNDWFYISTDTTELSRNGSCTLFSSKFRTGESYTLKIKAVDAYNRQTDRVVSIPFRVTEGNLPENGATICVSSEQVLTGERYSVWVYAPGAERTEILSQNGENEWYYWGEECSSGQDFYQCRRTFKARAYFPGENEPRETETVTVNITAIFRELGYYLGLREISPFATAGEAITIRLDPIDAEQTMIPDTLRVSLYERGNEQIWYGEVKESSEITIPAKKEGSALLTEGQDYYLHIEATKTGCSSSAFWDISLTTEESNTATIPLTVNDSTKEQTIACGTMYTVRATFPSGTTQYQVWNGDYWITSEWLMPGDSKVRMNMDLWHYALPRDHVEIYARYTSDPAETEPYACQWKYTRAVTVNFTCDHSETITEYEWNSDHNCTEDNEQTHTHTGTGKKFLRCTRCSKKIRDLEDVEGPITEKHIFDENICHECGYECLHEGIEVYEPKTTYEKCDSQYHYRYVNRGSYIVQCPHCNYSKWYSEESSMEPHTDEDNNQVCDLCGDIMAGNWDWQILDGDLIFSGTGTIPAFTSAEATPWYKDAAGIRRIILEEGISGIGAYAFAGFGDKTIRVDFTQSKLTDLTIDPDAFSGTDAICRYYSEDNSWPASKTTTSNYGGTQKWFYLSRRNVNNAISNIEYGANGSWRMDLYEYGQYESIDDTELMIELTFPERRVYLNAIPTAAADKAVYEDNLDTTGQITYAEGCTGSTILTLTEETKDDFTVFFDAPALTATINTGDCGHSIRMASVTKGSQITINGDVENLTLGSMETMGLLDTGNSSANVMINGDITALNYYSKYNKSTEAGFKANLTVNGTIKEGHVYGRTTLTVPNINPNGEGANKDTVPIGDTMVIRFKNVKQTGKIITDSEVTVAGAEPITQYTPGNCDLQYNYDKELGYWMLRVTPLDLEMGGDFTSSFVNISQYNPDFSLNDVYWGRSTGLVLGDMGTAEAPIELNAPEGKKIGFLQLMSDECHVKLNCPAQEVLIGGDRNYTGKYSLEINNRAEDLRIEAVHGDEVTVTSGANGSVRYGYYSIPMRRTRYFGPTSGAGTLFSNGKLQIMSWLPGERLRAILPSDDEVTEAAGLGANSIAVLEAEDASITLEQEQNDALAAIGATPDDVEQVFELYVKEYGLNENGSINYEIGTIQELTKPIEVAVTNGTGTRVAVVRMHEETDQETGEVTVRAAQITPFTNNRKISFESDRFSTYLLISEPEGEEINPSTLTKVITLPASVKRIEEKALEGIDAEAIIVPAGCEYIGDRAFANCPNLVYVTGPESATLAGDPFAGSNVKVYDTYKGKQD